MNRGAFLGYFLILLLSTATQTCPLPPQSFFSKMHTQTFLLQPTRLLVLVSKQQFHFQTLLYFVTIIKTLHQFCSLFPSSTTMLITKRRMCPPFQTKYCVFTFYSPPPCLLQPLRAINFQFFFQAQPLHPLPYHPFFCTQNQSVQLGFIENKKVSFQVGQYQGDLVHGW